MMAERLLEMQRILKPAGSIYLHCDPTASHYLKIVMDCVFGKQNFMNEIVWCYSTGGASQKRYAAKHDIILYYKKEQDPVFHTPRIKYTSAMSRDPKHAHKFHPEGKIMPDWWTDIPPLNPQAHERQGYPTQKPIELLLRIIAASSNEGDMVLDPFCGCATALVAAEKLERKWVGMDISYVAKFLVKKRMQEETNLFDRYEVTERTDVPERTDIKQEERNTLEIKQKKYEEQEGRCAGCNYPLPLRNLTKDRIVPGAKGGQYTEENIQLLCTPCNSMKGKNTMASLRARLKEQDLLFEEES